MAEIHLNHPKQRLAFIVTSGIDESVRLNIKLFIDRLGESRNWLLGSPKYVNFIEDVEPNEKGDQPIESTGGYIEIYTNLPPWTLPVDIDRLHLEEVITLVEALCVFAKEYKVSFELEIDEDFVGAIDNGEPDQCLTEGLIGEWKRRYVDRSDKT